MLRLRSFWGCSRRLCHSQAVGCDGVLDRLKACSTEDQVLDVVRQNQAKLSVSHVSCAVGLLWEFQIKRPHMLRPFNLIHNHPQFLTLRVLAKNNISLMDEDSLVDMLYHLVRLRVEHHDTLLQQLVMEAWNRLERFQMNTLSKLAVCLADMFLHRSPLMGQITHIVSQRLDSIKDAKVLTPLMISVYFLMSPKLRDAVVEKADTLLDENQSMNINNPRRVVQFSRNSRYVHRPLVEKCNQLFLQSIAYQDVEAIHLILVLYQSIQFINGPFQVAAKQRLVELMNTDIHPGTFSKLFAALGPMAEQHIRERLENTAVCLADELNAQEVMAVLDGMDRMHCRNLKLLNKMEEVFLKHLETYQRWEITRISQHFIYLHSQNPELLSKLKAKLTDYVQICMFPFEVSAICKVLSMFPFRHVDKAVFSRVCAVVPQCHLNGLSFNGETVSKWIHNNPSDQLNASSNCVELLQDINRCALERLQSFTCLEEFLDDVKFLSGQWFEAMVLDKLILTVQRMIDQISWTNVNEVAAVLSKNNYFCPALMDRMASVTVQNIDKMHYSAVVETVQPFGLLNYNPPHSEDFFDVCIRRITPYISSCDPYMLVLFAYALVKANYFPKEVIREIFTVSFLAKLGDHLRTFPENLNRQVRNNLLNLNRAACIECPEFYVPWFHDDYCKQLHVKVKRSISPIHRQIYNTLGEVLGGTNYIRVGVSAPYFYRIDFEFVLDRHRRPIPYSKLSLPQVGVKENVHMSSLSTEEKIELPSGARRIAMSFLSHRSFCRNALHITGKSMMKKRHLEILGYHVVQIPHFEWNSMELSTNDAWKEYLKKKIYAQLP